MSRRDGRIPELTLDLAGLANAFTTQAIAVRYFIRSSSIEATPTPELSQTIVLSGTFANVPALSSASPALLALLLGTLGIAGQAWRRNAQAKSKRSLGPEQVGEFE